MVTLTWHASKYKVNKLYQRCILVFTHMLGETYHRLVIVVFV